MRILPLACAVVLVPGTLTLSGAGVAPATVGRSDVDAWHAVPVMPAIEAGPSASLAITAAAAELPYTTQFENEWLKLVRVRYPANAKVPTHGHPTTVTTYIYLSGSSPVRFTHHGNRTHVVTRQPTTPGGFRVSRGGDEEHEVENLGPIASEFLRVEFKTDPAGESSPYYRDNRPLGAAARASEVRFTNKQMRITRLAVPAGGRAEIAAPANQPALVVALDGGKEQWVAPGRTETVTSAGKASEFLRIDFLTGPAK